MPSARILNEHKKIIEIVWDGMVEVKDVQAINSQVLSFAEQVGRPLMCL